MKLIINMEEIKPSYDEIIDKQLEESNLPICIGQMSPPMVRNLLEIEDTDYFIKEEIVDTKEVDNTIDTFRLTNGNFITQGNMKMVLTKDKADKLRKLKEKIAIKYTDQIYKCTTCTIFDICDKLSTHYRENIKLLENKK